MSESDQRRKVVRLLKPVDAVSVENRVGIGTPDVNYAEGWIELKWLRRWPKQDVVVKIEHFTKQQRIWLRRRWRAGGAAWLLLQVRREWLLFDGETAAEVVGYATRGTLVDRCTAYFQNGINEGLIECLQR